MLDEEDGVELERVEVVDAEDLAAEAGPAAGVLVGDGDEGLAVLGEGERGDLGEGSRP
ncbi:MAG: hypothetical protein M5U26_04335 [Planctomycetota bacterium]|nr:hypothetical protein [Planctomycetota bacterium]